MTTRPDAYVTYPGVANQYQHSPDLNVLDADTGNIHQTIGEWVASAGIAVAPALSTAIVPIFGTSHGITRPEAGAAEGRIAAGTPGVSFAVDPSTEYTFSVYMASDQPDMQGRIRVQWFDSGGGFISSGPAPDFVDLGQDVFSVQVLSTATSPSNAAFVVILVGWQASSGTLSVTDDLYWDAVLAVAGASPTFVPSLRIVGDLDIRIDADPSDWFTGGNSQYLAARWGINAGIDQAYALFLDTDSSSEVVANVGPGPRKYGFTPALVTGTRARLRFTFDEATGDGILYVDDVAEPTVSQASGPIDTADRELEIGSGGESSPGAGSLYDGKLYSVEIRDGIDGPIVADWYPNDQIAGSVP